MISTPVPDEFRLHQSCPVAGTVVTNAPSRDQATGDDWVEGTVPVATMS
jgi:hypothetical protein